MRSQQIPLLEESLHPLHDDPLLLTRSLALQILLLHLQSQQGGSIVISTVAGARWLRVEIVSLLLKGLRARALEVIMLPARERYFSSRLGFGDLDL